MNILFLTVSNIYDINQRGIYTDLMRKFRDNGHSVYIVSPVERRLQGITQLKVEDGVYILNVKTLNIQKTNILEKGLATLLLEYQYSKAIANYLSDKKFDLILYSTPPITLNNVIRRVKKENKAKTYLLLKDIFPQNAVDLGMIKANSLIHRFFLRKERNMYFLSDFIGCMSPANVNYLLHHNPQINPQTVEVNPNSIEPLNQYLKGAEKQATRQKYKIPQEATVFIYGGNLGKPQGLNFLLDILEYNISRTDVFFVIVGSGTEYGRIESWFRKKDPKNALLLPKLDKEEYDRFVQSCDIGMILLDPRFTIPNFPSRLLSYLEYRLPVIASTDKNTDIGSILEENKIGYWCLNGDIVEFNKLINKIINDKEKLRKMGDNGFNYLTNNYSVERSYEIIMNRMNRCNQAN